MSHKKLVLSYFIHIFSISIFWNQSQKVISEKQDKYSIFVSEVFQIYTMPDVYIKVKNTYVAFIRFLLGLSDQLYSKM